MTTRLFSSSPLIFFSAIVFLSNCTMAESLYCCVFNFCWYGRRLMRAWCDQSLLKSLRHSLSRGTLFTGHHSAPPLVLHTTAPAYAPSRRRITSQCAGIDGGEDTKAWRRVTRVGTERARPESAYSESLLCRRRPT